jgi:hypothetical protein
VTAPLSSPPSVPLVPAVCLNYDSTAAPQLIMKTKEHMLELGSGQDSGVVDYNREDDGRMVDDILTSHPLSCSAQPMVSAAQRSFHPLIADMKRKTCWGLVTENGRW